MRNFCNAPASLVVLESETMEVYANPSTYPQLFGIAEKELRGPERLKV